MNRISRSDSLASLETVIVEEKYPLVLEDELSVSDYSTKAASVLKKADTLEHGSQGIITKIKTIFRNVLQRLISVISSCLIRCGLKNSRAEDPDLLAKVPMDQNDYPANNQ